MSRDNLNMLACLNTFGKKPIDILLELIQIEAYDLDINESYFTKTLSEKLQKKYDITIPNILLNKWVSSKFNKKNNKLVLNTCNESLDVYIKKIEAKEDEFNKEMKEIRNDFKKYAKTMYDLSLTDGNVRDVFNNYFYIDSCYENLSSEDAETKKSKLAFIFSRYMKYLFENKHKYLDKIENFGVANQIRKVVINEDKDIIDRKFLEGCDVYIDTPIMIKSLGYDGKELADSYTEILNAIKKSGARLCFFEHSFDELWGILFSFKKNIAQNFLDTKGVNQFLRAREEYKKDGIELSLDEKTVLESIKKIGCDIRLHINNEDLSGNSCFKYWSFNEAKFTDIVNNRYNSRTVSQTCIERDVKSISSISRLREKSDIKAPTSYKDGKFFLLSDNYTLIECLKEYYKDEEPNDTFQLNELIFENTILFELWQNIFDNNTFNKALFRSKCFAFNEIDEKFKDKLYRICRKYDRYMPEKNMSKQFIAHPELEEEVYKQVLKTKEYNDNYLEQVMNNIVIQNEEKLKNEIIIKMSEEAKKKDSEYEHNIEKEKEKATNDRQEFIINNGIKNLKRNPWNWIIFRLKKFFNKDLDEYTYYRLKLKKIIDIE
ncbi:MAG: hypothetical protein ACTTIZ_07660 [Treponema sp.]